jgi:DNA invertase Pin-like site-specific DNA recombinase
MLKTTFDAQKPYRFVSYGRMSSDQQNPRSPDQQFDTIKSTLQRSGYPWIQCGDYRDDGISGRYVSKRPGFQKMLEDIKTGRITADLILVDTLERFGRMEELPELRRSLQNKHGILVLTADSVFADPTSTAGQALGMIEAIRSTTEAQAKAHNVLRGKIDSAKRKRWPGGKSPFGYQLKRMTLEGATCLGTDYTVLEPDPVAAEEVRRIFRMADDEGLGATRIARRLNEDRDFVEAFGQFDATRIGYILDNPIYKGVLRFGRVATGIVDDSRVQRRNEKADVLLVPDFCDPLVAVDIWERVATIRRARGQRMREIRAEQKNPDGKQIAALKPGLVLKYPLSGIARCGLCGGSMRANRSGAKSRTTRSYYYYLCPRARDGRCTNMVFLPGDWLWEAVIARLREFLFPLPDQADESAPEWLDELIDEVRHELIRRTRDQQQRRPELEQETRDLESSVHGWTQSLSNADLPREVRSEIETRFQSALTQIGQIKTELARLTGEADYADSLLDAQQVIDSLARLDEVLARGNPTEINAELAKHIVAIKVFPDERVVLQTTRLGLFEGVEVMLTEQARPAPPVNEDLPGNGRTRRSRFGDRVELPLRWVDEAIFRAPRRRCWSDANAEEVARHRLETGDSLAKVAKHFDRSIPTIRRALRVAQERAEGASDGDGEEDAA